MHGVSHSILSSVFSTLSLPAFVPVEEQKEPDPEFRTVGFPNPEERGALVSMDSVTCTCLACFVLFWF